MEKMINKATKVIPYTFRVLYHFVIIAVYSRFSFDRITTHPKTIAINKIKISVVIQAIVCIIKKTSQHLKYISIKIKVRIKITFVELNCNLKKITKNNINL